jgi:DNA topoisomerase-1
VTGQSRTRIEALAIPPAWERVWICPHPRGHLQATGYDARGRKQYRYHPEWSAVRNAAKFGELAAFGAALPRIRRRIALDLARRGLARERVLACIVSILDRTHVRIGNDEYARSNDSYGLTTILNKHARVDGDHVMLRFRAKSGVECRTSLRSARAARIVRRCQELPGHELFCYVDERGATRDVGSGDVNRYLREITGADFTSKHFRTWGGSVIAAEALHRLGPLEHTPTQREAKRRQLEAIDAAASQLCNTRAVCRKYYVHPLLFEADLDGRLHAAFKGATRPPSASGLRPAERALLRLLRDTERRKTGPMR